MAGEFSWGQVCRVLLENAPSAHEDDAIVPRMTLLYEQNLLQAPGGQRHTPLSRGGSYSASEAEKKIKACSTLQLYILPYGSCLSSEKANIRFSLCPGSLLGLAEGDVVTDFYDDPACMKFFYQGKVPDWGSTTPRAARICQHFLNTYHFATLYDTYHRIASYSAYVFEASSGGGRETRWFVEPQLVNQNWGGEMKDSAWLDQAYPGVYQGDRQALNEDYTHSGFDRGHLNPNGHHAVPGRNATFSLTNVVPQNPKLNQNAWANHEASLAKMFKAQCDKAYVLVGAIPSAENWIIKNNTKRVNIPEYMWNAYCCIDRDGRPVLTGGAIALNSEQNLVVEHTLRELVEFLQQHSHGPVGELFHHHCQ
ncbi:endonuclease domain-containing 1 protein [Brachyhypopomus gauderio]|uniref:endonuclease domain-containing 1 protein n=1 Tax=Brachyhypopomus gauderio TaxID=698409 RepID=UPI004042815E